MTRHVFPRVFIAACGILLAFCSGSATKPSNNNNQQTCSYTVTPSASISASGGPGAATVTSTGNTSCTWNASTENNTNNWITLTGSTSGSGSGSVAYSASANPNTSTRSANIVITWTDGGGGTVKDAITQDAAGAGTCVVALSSHAQSAPFNGKADQFAINPSSGCGSWKIDVDVPWITINSSSSGSGSGVINFTTSANTGGVRSGTITVTSGSSSDKLVVTQDSAVLTAVLHVTSTTGKGDNTCDLIAVSGNAGIQCKFDGSLSTPAGGIAKYEFFIVETGTSLGTGSSLPVPVITTCSVLSKVAKDKTGTKLTPTIRLTVTSTDGHTTASNVPPLVITLTSTGPC